jgi:hypothetical protein
MLFEKDVELRFQGFSCEQQQFCANSCNQMRITAIFQKIFYSQVWITRDYSRLLGIGLDRPERI